MVNVVDKGGLQTSIAKKGNDATVLYHSTHVQALKGNI